MSKEKLLEEYVKEALVAYRMNPADLTVILLALADKAYEAGKED